MPVLIIFDYSHLIDALLLLPPRIVFPVMRTTEFNGVSLSVVQSVITSFGRLTDASLIRAEFPFDKYQLERGTFYHQHDLYA